MYNPNSLDTICSALCYAMGIKVPDFSTMANKDLVKYIDETLSGEKADRIFMYNPDAIAQWIFEKYPHFFTGVNERTDIKVPLCSVMPSVTPVCFGTMYTGTQPKVHGIKSYTKPVITIDTIFDALIREGKKPVILAYGDASLSKIYLERDMDYFHFADLDEVNAKAAELILSDKYDFYVVYNGNYDAVMHKFGPESPEALAELRANARAYSTFDCLIKEHWKNHNTLVGFAMDHGCHEIDSGSGSHGLDMEEDLNITHLYKIHKCVK
ncbi:MAG: hypothetical protein E7551_07210 [Ruminococcaceae bacterium]|nr:hypothetical protein [Oscillospiraceae bacterium]